MNRDSNGAIKSGQSSSGFTDPMFVLEISLVTIKHFLCFFLKILLNILAQVFVF